MGQSSVFGLFWSQGLRHPAHVLPRAEIPLYPKFQPAGCSAVAGYKTYTDKQTDKQTNTEDFSSIDSIDMTIVSGNPHNIGLSTTLPIHS